MKKGISNKIYPIKCYVDRKSIIDSLFSTKAATEKGLKIDICIICKMFAKNEVVSIEWCKGELQLAECLTKGKSSNTKYLNVLKEWQWSYWVVKQKRTKYVLLKKTMSTLSSITMNLIKKGIRKIIQH